MNNEKKQAPRCPYWLDDSKPAPRCPYCGGEMGLNELFEREKGWVASLICKCGACAPIVIGEKTALSAIEAAYNAAMTCWQEPNRVLTLDELKTYIGYAWYEGDHKWYHSSFDYPVWIEDGKYNYEGDLYDIPDVEGRFWLRKPTKAELDAKREDEDER